MGKGKIKNERAKKLVLGGRTAFLNGQMGQKHKEIICKLLRSFILYMLRHFVHLPPRYAVSRNTIHCYFVTSRQKTSIAFDE